MSNKKLIEKEITKMVYNLSNDQPETAKQHLEKVISLKIEDLIRGLKDKPLNLSK